jgi:hypothetical protein
VVRQAGDVRFKQKNVTSEWQTELLAIKSRRHQMLSAGRYGEFSAHQ